MKEQKDYFSYLIGLGGLFLTIITFFKKENQQLMLLIWGAAVLVIAVTMIYINKYLNKLDYLDDEIKTLKKEYSYSNEV